MNTHRLMLAGLVIASAGVVAFSVRMGWLSGAGAKSRGAGRGGRVIGREVRSIEAPVWLVSALVIYLSQWVGASLATAAVGPPANLTTPLPPGTLSFEQTAVVQGLAYMFAITIGLVVIGMLRARAGDEAGLRVRWSDVPRGVLALVLIAPLYMLTAQVSTTVSHLWSDTPTGPIKHETLEQLRTHGGTPWAWVLIAAAVIGAPVVEEFAFRAGLQSFWRRVTGAAWKGDGWAAILITSGLFALVHIGAVPPSGIPALFVLGIGFGLAYERTGRLGVPIVMHAVFNAMNILAVVGGWVG